MGTFTEEDRERDLYERQKMGLWWHNLEKQELAELKEALKSKDEALKEVQRSILAFETEQNRLRQLLLQAGLNPDSQTQAR